jgi:serine protein kinase
MENELNNGNNHDFREIEDEDLQLMGLEDEKEDDISNIFLSQQKDRGVTNWEGSLADYIGKVKEKPEIANLSPARIYNMIMKNGTSSVSESLKTKGYEDLVKYNFFEGKIFGALEPIHDMMKFFRAAAKRTETGKRILLLVGPVSSGKSTLAALIKKGLEQEFRYSIKGCPIHEEPLHAIPEENREYWSERLGVKIEGDLCPVCRQRLKTEFTNAEGVEEWHKFPVEMIRYSEQDRVGIGTFQPSDPKSQDITELIGRVNLSKVAIYGETDPRAFQFNGELQVANTGVIEYIEILKADVKFHYTLITLAQEQKIKSPGFPQMYIDTTILSHTNETEFEKFRNEKTNEALHDRIYRVTVPWNDRVEDEMQILKKMLRESEFENVHISPGALEVAAQFAVLTRLVPANNISLVKKMKLYNGEYLEEFTKGRDVEVKKLREEGRDNGECRKGVSPRFITDALNIAMGSGEINKCITPLDMIRALRNNFKHRIGFPEKDAKHYLTLLTGDKESVIDLYKEFARKEVTTSFIHAFEDQADELFRRYMCNVVAFCKNDTVFDEVTGEYHDPDEKIMRAIEEQIPVPQESKGDFRKGIFVYKSDSQEQGEEFSWDSYKPLKDAIEKKLMSDLKNVVTLSIADTTTTAPKAKARRRKALRTLEQKGYCQHCAKQLLAFVGEILRREN